MESVTIINENNENNENEDSNNDNTNSISLDDVDPTQTHQDGWNSVNHSLLQKMYKMVKVRSKETAKSSDISFIGISDGLSENQKNGFLIAAGAGNLIGSAMLTIYQNQQYAKKDTMNSVMSNLFFSLQNDLQTLIYSPTDTRGQANQVITRNQKSMSGGCKNCCGGGCKNCCGGG
eukprot:Pgem_evm4s12513